MRRALYCALSLTTFAPWAFPGSNLTVILDFKGPHSNGAVSEMQRETETIFKDSGLHLDWRFREEALHASYDDLVLVRFRGACVLEPAPYPPYLYDELLPIRPMERCFPSAKWLAIRSRPRRGRPCAAEILPGPICSWDAPSDACSRTNWYTS